MKALFITAWDDLYETAETRKIRNLTYYAKPNKLVGEGIGLTLAQPDNVALLGTWALIEAVASTSPQKQRGYLVRNGSALDAARIAALTRVDVKHFERAFAHFQQPEVRWLMWKEVPGSSPGDSANPPIAGTPPGDSPGTLPDNSGKTENPPIAGKSPGRFRQEREKKEREEKIRERGETGHTPGATRVPAFPDVETWATEAGVPLEFARQKFQQASRRNDFAKWAKRGVEWKAMFGDFWQEDGEAWLKKQKNAAPPAAGSASRPDGWKAGDMDFWWTDSLADLRAALQGAAAMSDKKTADRLLEILKLRETN